MRRVVGIVVLVLAAALGAVVVARAGAARPVTAFRTADAAAACRLEGRALVCSSLGSPGSVALAGGSARIVDRLPWWDASTPVLRTWSHGTIACTLLGGAILCRDGSTSIRVTGSGFAVAA